MLHDKVKKITAIDADDHAISIGQNRFFYEYDNVDWITADVFEDYRDVYDKADIFINTSCEHMRPMKEWPYWNSNCFFALQSNNMERRILSCQKS